MTPSRGVDTSSPDPAQPPPLMSSGGEERGGVLTATVTMGADGEDRSNDGAATDRTNIAHHSAMNKVANGEVSPSTVTGDALCSGNKSPSTMEEIPTKSSDDGEGKNNFGGNKNDSSGDGSRQIIEGVGTKVCNSTGKNNANNALNVELDATTDSSQSKPRGAPTKNNEHHSALMQPSPSEAPGSTAVDSASEAAPTDNKADGPALNERQQKISASIHHRRQLLAWIRRTREKSQQLQEQYRGGEKVGFIAAIANATSALPSPSQLGASGLPRSELGDYRLITSMANNRPTNLLKRTKSSGVDNSAIAKSLAVNRRASAPPVVSASLAINGSPGGTKAASPSAAAHPPGTKLSKLAAPSSAAKHHPPQGKQFPSSNKNRPMLPTKHNKLLAATANSGGDNDDLLLSNYGGETKHKKKKRKKDKGGMDSAVADGILKASLHHQNNTYTKHGQLGVGQSSSSSMLPMVPSQMAMSLLERREGLVNRLNEMLLLRIRKQQHEEEKEVTPRNERDMNTDVKVPPASSAKPKVKEEHEGGGGVKTTHMTTSVQTSAFAVPPLTTSKPVIIDDKRAAQSKRPFHFSALATPSTPPDPSRLPPRRRTHWDAVLEEMRWMATDFASERKWKMAVGKRMVTTVKEKWREQQMLQQKMKSRNKRRRGAGGVLGTPPLKGVLSPSIMFGSSGSGSGGIVRSSVSRSSKSTPRSIGSSYTRQHSKDNSRGGLGGIGTGDSDPLYVSNITPSDVKHTMHICKVLSVSVLDYWESQTPSTTDCRSVPSSLEGRDCERLKRLKEGIVDSKNNLLLENGDDGSGSSVDSTTDFNNDDRPKLAELGYDEISLQLKTSVKLAAAISANSDGASAGDDDLDYGGIACSPGQKCAVDLLSRLWGGIFNIDDNVSTNSADVERKGGEQETNNLLLMSQRYNVSPILGGGFGVGKTVSVCSMLWKESNGKSKDGPQIIVCSSSSLFRWKNELEKFEGLKGHIYHAGRDAANHEFGGSLSYSTTDVILCDYWSFAELVTQRHRKGCRNKFMSNAVSLVLDLRGPSSSSDSDPVNNVKWWIRLNEFVANAEKNMKRLVIEQSGLPRNCFLEHKNGNGEKRRRSVDEVLAMKLAFVHHPSVFFSEHASIGKRVISWARYQAKKEKTAQSDDSDSSLPGFRSVLIAFLREIREPTFVDLSQLEESRNDNNSLPRMTCWEAQMCSLENSQQAAYELCCPQVQGPNRKVAETLLRLRKICVHSNLDQVVESVLAPRLQQQMKSKISWRKNGSILVKSSATWSEPNIHSAKQIIDSSSKMKELLRILTRDCGYEVSMESELVGDMCVGDKEQREEMEPKKIEKKAKVLILASLVNAQLLTSFFLSAVGLHHEVLVSLDTKQQPLMFPTENGSDASWMWSQDIIRLFNTMKRDTTGRSLDILIASPKTISSHSSGIGATSADVVISIDEDWSGREGLHVNSIITKTGRAETLSPTRSRCRFIKLVCQNTCEAKFLCQENGNAAVIKAKANKPNVGTRKSSRKSRRVTAKTVQNEMGGDERNHINATGIRCPLPLCLIREKSESISIDNNGFLIPPDPEVGGSEQSSSESNDQSVASNILQYRNKRSSSVFCVTHSHSDYFFLPGKNVGDRCHNAKADCIYESCEDVKIAWALFNAEDGALFAPADGFEMKSISPCPVPMTGASNSVRSYVDSFKQSALFTSENRSTNQIKLFENGRLVLANGLNHSDPDCATKEDSQKGGISNDELLVYKVPSSESRKRKSSSDGLVHSAYSFCFSSSNNSTPALLGDGNRGCEPLVYFPSFYQSLLQMIQQMTHVVSQGGAEHGTKRKEFKGKDNNDWSKKSRFCLNGGSSLTKNLHAALQKQDAVSHLESKQSGPFSLSMETNPHSFWRDDSKAGNTELTFSMRLLSGDLRGVVSCQNWSSSKSMIAIAYKNQSPKSTTQSTEPKMKPNSFERGGTSYFADKRMYGFATRKFTNPALTTQLCVGQIRLQGHFNELVSKTLVSSSVHPTGQRSIGSAMLRALPYLDKDIDQSTRGPKSGIALPFGVKVPQAATKNSQDSWSHMEDLVLEESLTRYGENWQLVADAVSSGKFFHFDAVEGRGEYSLLGASRHSPEQCQSRWNTLKSDKMLPPSRALSSATFNSTTTSSVELSNCGAGEGGTVIVSSSIDRFKQVGSQLHTVGLEKNGEVLSRIQKLKEVSKGRRVATTTMPPYSEPTHASHSDVIHAARQNMISAANGVPPPRTEMWPLELLDYVKYNATNRNPRRDAPRGPAPHTANSDQPPPRHHQHPPHNFHPAPSQHQGNVYHRTGQIPPNQPPQYPQGHANHAYPAQQQRSTKRT